MAHLQHLASQPPSVRPLAGSMARLVAARESWPQHVLGDFSLRMANHGLSVSSCMMQRDPGYALEQLHHAHTLPDPGLRELAHAMARDFERKQTEVADMG